MKLFNSSHSPQILLTGIAVLFLTTMRCDADVLLKYEMGQLDPQIQDPVNTVAGDILLPGAGLSTFSYTSTQYPISGYSLAVTFTGAYPNLEAATNNSAWFTFAVTVGSGVTNLDLTSLALNAARGGTSTPRGYGAFVTTPTTTDELLQAATDLTTQRPNWGPRQEIPLAGVASLQGLTNGQVINFKIAVYSPAAGSSVDFDNITLNGIANFTTNEAPVQPLLITDIKPQTDAVELTWLSNTGKVYAVQYSLDLMNWSNLATDIAAAADTNKTSVLLDLSGASAGTNAILAQYQMGTNAAQIQSTTSTVAASNLTAGLGLNVFNANFGGSYLTAPDLTVAFNVAGADLATAIANTNLFTFTLTVGSNVTDLDLTSLSFNAARGGTGVPRGYGVLVNTPTTTDELVQGATDLMTVRPFWSAQNISLTGIASLQNLIAGQTITFTIPVYAPATANSLEFDDITVKGNVFPAPIPSYVGAPRLYLRVTTTPSF
jgi:hypothetical protein